MCSFTFGDSTGENRQFDGGKRAKAVSASLGVTLEAGGSVVEVGEFLLCFLASTEPETGAQ